MAVSSGEECHSVLVLPERGNTNLQYESLPNISYKEVPNLMKKETCLDAEPNLQIHTNLKVDRVNGSTPCGLDIDVEKGKEEILKFNEESVAKLKFDDSLAREICVPRGEKFMQLLMNNGTDLPKFTSRDKFLTQRACDTLTNRTRKYKRSPSFNSRRVLLLFSALSSMGTIILIYLTLRVRQISDGFGNPPPCFSVWEAFEVGFKFTSTISSCLAEERASIPGRATAIFRNRGCNAS